MWLTSVSIRRPVFISMFVLALVVLGWQSLRRMPAELNPDITFPFITVITIYPGAGPQEIETLVSEPIEEALSSVGNLRNITSTSQDGISVVFLELELGTDLDAAAADVRDKIAAARATLPRDIEEPQISKLNITSMPILTLGFFGPQSPRELRHFADTRIKDSISSVGGVAAVTVNGGAVREIAIDVDRDRLSAYGLSIDQVAAAIRAENLTLPSGTIKQTTREYAVRALGEFESADQIRNIRINVPDPMGGPPALIRLGDIAKVRDTVEEPQTLTRLNGKDAVVIAVQKQSDANTIEVADGVKRVLYRLGWQPTEKEKKYLGKMGRMPVQSQLPPGSRIVIATDESEFVRDSLHDVRSALMEGIFLVVVIVFLFLHRGRATFIVALAIPTSIFATFLPIWSFGFTLNQMTLLALSLAVGILVDDSIVVLENIERHLRMGEPPPDAALNGRSEIGLAAITITMVDVVVFIPIAFMGGIVGQFFRQFGITVATATLFSLFVSFTLTPMLAAKWLRQHGDDLSETAEGSGSGQMGMLSRINVRAGRFFERFDRFYSALDMRYRAVLQWALTHRFLTVVIGFVSLLTVFSMAAKQLAPAVAAIAILLSLLAAIINREAKGVAIGFGLVMVAIAMLIRFPFGFEMFPRIDQGEFSITVEAPAGSSLKATDRVVRDIEAVLAKIPEMAYYHTTVGSSTAGVFGAGAQGSQYARIAVKLVDKARRERSVEDVAEQVTREVADIPGAAIRVAVSEGLGGGGSPLEMEITGPNMNDILKKAAAVQAILEKTPGVINVENSWKVGKPELQVTVDRLRAADHGVTVGQVATAMRTAIEGNTDAKYREAGDEYDIRVRFASTERRTMSDVANIIVGFTNGSPIYLRDVARIELKAAPQVISRKNRQRLVTVGGGLTRDAKLGNVQRIVNRAVAKLPESSARVETGGIGQVMAESFRYMFSALMLSIVLVYMLMAALFESLASPFIIMFSLPQALVGALLGLMITGKSLSIVSMIGIIMLVGLVSKNAILLVDYTNTLRSRGKSRDEALLEAGPTRLRPILMTTTAMVGGMLPTAIALGGSRGAEIRSPMAIAVIGGLLLSLFLTLLVIPTVYAIVDDLTGRFRHRKPKSCES